MKHNSNYSQLTTVSSYIVYLPLFVQAVQGQSPTSSSAIMTPLTFTIAILSIITGSVVSKLGRYQIIVIVGAIILAGGVFLMTQLNATASLLEITLDVFLIGVGTGAVTFLPSMGSTMATAVLGTIVNTISQGEINVNLSAVAHRFPDAYLRAATEKQVLTSAAYRQSIIQQGISTTVNAAHVPPGPQHGGTIASLTQQTTSLLNHLFEVVRQSLAIGIHQAFIVSFCLCLAIVVITPFLKDTSATRGEDVKREELVIEGTVEAPLGTYVLPIEEKGESKEDFDKTPLTKKRTKR